MHCTFKTHYSLSKHWNWILPSVLARDCYDGKRKNRQLRRLSTYNKTLIQCEEGKKSLPTYKTTDNISKCYNTPTIFDWAKIAFYLFRHCWHVVPTFPITTRTPATFQESSGYLLFNNRTLSILIPLSATHNLSALFSSDCCSKYVNFASHQMRPAPLNHSQRQNLTKYEVTLLKR